MSSVVQHNNQLDSPTFLIIFGITGDLSRRKLLPALWHLYRHHLLPRKFRIIGFSRRDFSDELFASFVRDTLANMFSAADTHTVRDFLSTFSYRQGHFNVKERYEALGEYLQSLERTYHTSANKLFYLAISPAHYEIALQNLHDSGITKHTAPAHPARILIEKPFGKDVDTAMALDEKLGKLFAEDQIYRIDHYLAKEMVQNMVNFRFSNFIFEALWNSVGIEKVHIRLLETLGMEGRGVFYSDTGALRDVGQNHLLQMLAVIAMENPGKLDAQHIRHARADVLGQLQSVEDFSRDIVRGQYEGFTLGEGIDSDAQTETYFKIRAFLNSPRWKGVPFILESGKRMRQKVASIIIYFKQAPGTLCTATDSRGCQNTLTFTLQPQEDISILFWAKKPGLSNEVEPRTLHFSYRDGTHSEHLPDAYERVLYDCFSGDQTLFAGTDEVRAAWHFITPIIERWHSQPLHAYGQGTDGPTSESFDAYA